MVLYTPRPLLLALLLAWLGSGFPAGCNSSSQHPEVWLLVVLFGAVKTKLLWRFMPTKREDPLEILARSRTLQVQLVSTQPMYLLRLHIMKQHKNVGLFTSTCPLPSALVLGVTPVAWCTGLSFFGALGTTHPVTSHVAQSGTGGGGGGMPGGPRCLGEGA